MNNASLSGFLLIDKPINISSFDVIRQLRRQTKIRTFGHAGTLDPFATGLLIIAVNRYTRLLSLLEFADKAYTATLVFGKATATGDTEGEIIQTDDKLINSDELNEMAIDILNIKALKPPIHSAIKVNGKRAYERARASEVFELPERESHVYDFAIQKFEFPYLTYSCRVSKGTYIRSLSQWIAERLGTVAYTSELRRTAIGKVSVQSATQLDEINDSNLEEHLTFAPGILPEMESLALNDEEIKRIRNGNSIPNTGIDNNEILLFEAGLSCIGLAYRKDNSLNPKINI